MQTIQTAFTLGKTALPRTAILAPMAGVADRAYRLLCRSFGAAATVSEMVSVKGLCYGDKGSAELCTITEPHAHGLAAVRQRAGIRGSRRTGAAVRTGLDWHQHGLSAT